VCEAHDRHDDGRYSIAQPQQATIPQASIDRINSSPNGGVVIHGTDRSDILVHACIQASAPSEQEARSIASQVQIVKTGGEIEPDGPRQDHDRHWSVSYEVWLPRTSNLEIKTVNGQIRIEDVNGDIESNSVNGGVDLLRLGGNVKTATVNGGVRVELAGSTWAGHGLTVSTTNGGIRFIVPGSYSANVETSTVNGGIQCDFPISIQGHLTKHVSFQLGNGGPEIHTATVNGGIRFVKGA
jgi:DUF4097 and DUF4098 domain-containing protein YvlB